jgi:hypothetical protein
VCLKLRKSVKMWIVKVENLLSFLTEEDEESESKEKSSKINVPKSKYVAKMDRLMNGNVYLVQSVRIFLRLVSCDVIILQPLSFIKLWRHLLDEECIPNLVQRFLKFGQQINYYASFKNISTTDKSGYF